MGERDAGCGEEGGAGRSYQPASVCEPISGSNGGEASENVRDLRAIVPQRVDAEYTVLDHDRIGLAAPTETHEERRRRVRHRTNRGGGGAALTGRAGSGDAVDCGV